jgi:heme/copper-type cytochrome/quinol oxidase subunit 2
MFIFLELINKTSKMATLAGAQALNILKDPHTQKTIGGVAKTWIIINGMIVLGIILLIIVAVIAIKRKKKNDKKKAGETFEMTSPIYKNLKGTDDTAFVRSGK